MRDLKIRPGMDGPKAKLKNPEPKDAKSILKKHMDKRQQEKGPESRDPVRYATDRVEKNMRRGTDLAADGSRRAMKRYRRQQRKDVKDTATTPQELRWQNAMQDAGTATYGRDLAEKGVVEWHIVPPLPNCGGTMATQPKGNRGTVVRSSLAPKSGQAMTKATRTMRVRPTGHTVPNNAIITRHAKAAAQRKAKRAMLQDAAKKGGKTVKKLGGTAVQTVKAVGRGVASAVSSLLTAGGGAVVLVLLLIVMLVAAVVASPFGILFSNESREAGVVPLAAAVAQVNYDLNEQLEALQAAADYDSISIEGQAADWAEVLAVFAVKVAGSDDVDAADVATMDADRIARLKAVFWDMTTITHRIEVIPHPGSGKDDDGWTERNLYIAITAKTAEGMKT